MFNPLFIISSTFIEESFVEKEKVDLILLDIMMPDLTGWDVYERIRKKDKNVKVAFLSILDISPSRKKEFLDKGVSDYITKPFNAKELAELREVLKISLGKHVDMLSDDDLSDFGLTMLQVTAIALKAKYSRLKQ